MTQMQSLSTVQHRLAQHYLDTLRRANAAIYRGQGNRAHWYGQVERDWEQIRQWQTWSATAAKRERERARICLDFSIAGLEVLRVRQTPMERIAWLQQALEAAQQINDVSAGRTILHELGHTYFVMGASADARATGRRLLQMAEESGDDFNAGRAWYVLGQTELHEGLLDESAQSFEKSIALLESVGAEAELGRALQGMGRVAMFRGDNQNAYPLFVRYLQIVERSGREAELAPACITMNNILLELRKYPEAKAYAERAVQVCLKTGFQRMLPSAWLCLGAAESEMDALDAAAEHLTEGLAVGRVVHSPAGLIDMLRYLADVRMRQGDYQAAFEHFQEALLLSREYNILYYLCEVTAALARWHLDQGQPEAARAQLREAVDFALKLKSDNFLVLVLIPAIRLWQAENRLEQAGVWAGLLMQYPNQTLPRIFDPLCRQLERDLGAERYRSALEQGKTLTLEGAVSEVVNALNA